MTDADAPVPVRLADYRTPAYLVERVALRFELDAERTRVHSRLHVRRNTHTPAAAPLVLDGEQLVTHGIAVDGQPLPGDAYVIDGGRLHIANVPAEFELAIETEINPRANRSGEGMFRIRGQLATQCEPEGFRRLTWFPDRPDVLAVYTVTLVADRALYPVLLSNGSVVERGELDGGRHVVTWHDPHPKPCYIFAVMAGTWSCLQDEYVTRSGKRVQLGIHADAGVIAHCEFAMGALKRALAWEEATFGLEYDLPVYNIVALTDYVGAMENKGLNLFEAHGIVADPETSTDDDQLLIERILAHEVFHNWTGNRVTCRDWFQLAIKEGLTRLRDQLFAQDMALSAWKRIDQVKALRRNQFPEDAGPAAHPVQPKTYVAIRNFYTGTVYDKGAEVVRMLLHLLGRETFIAGVRAFVQRHDLQAVTKDEFLAAMRAVSGRDLLQFEQWYDHAGRPTVTATDEYDAQARTCTLTLSQRLDTPVGSAGAPAPLFHIPVSVGLIGQSGGSLPFRHPVTGEMAQSHLLELTAARQQFVFEGVAEPVVPSLLRGFTAPVTLEARLDDAQLAHLMAFDDDAFARWDAAQQLGVNVVRRLARDWRAGTPLVLPAEYARAFGTALLDERSDPSVLSEILRIPDEPVLSDGLARIDLDAQVAARRFVVQQLAAAHRDALLQRYERLATGPHRFEPDAIAHRKLRNACLEHLCALAEPSLLDLCLAHLQQADNMTDMFDALSFLAQVRCPQRDAALAWFYERWQAKDRVIDKWFTVQALSRVDGAVDEVLALESHPAMSMSNRPRSMAFYGSFFRQNRVAFHDPSGKGYEMLADRLLYIDKANPGATYWLMPQILQWRRYDDARQLRMRAVLERVARSPGISKALQENVGRALAD